MNQFIQLLAKTVVGQVDTFSQATLRKITSYFSSYRPTVSFDYLPENKNMRIPQLKVTEMRMQINLQYLKH